MRTHQLTTGPFKVTDPKAFRSWLSSFELFEEVACDGTSFKVVMKDQQQVDLLDDQGSFRLLIRFFHEPWHMLNTASFKRFANEFSAFLAPDCATWMLYYREIAEENSRDSKDIQFYALLRKDQVLLPDQNELMNCAVKGWSQN